jgi:hypothetical protein
MKLKKLTFTLGTGVLAVLVAAIIMAFTLYKAPDKKEDLLAVYENLLKEKKFETLTEQLKQNYSSKDFTNEIEFAGHAIARNATIGMAYVDYLMDTGDELSVSLAAELLMQSARNGELRDYQVKKIQNEIDLITTDQIAERAVNLLDNDDPFVRSLADFAISIRIGVENWNALEAYPGENKPKWWAKWKNTVTEGDNALSLDYARQASERGLHRSVKAIAKEAPVVVERAKKILAVIVDNGNANKAEKDFAEIEKLAAEMQSEDNLKEARIKYIELRNQARQLIMQNPGFDFDQVVFALNYAFNDYGNITNGGKSYVIKPGGDIVIKDGFNPSSKTKELINGRLGPGHTRGYELHYNADKLVFSFAPQPHYYEIELWESDQGFDDGLYGMTTPNNLYEIDLISGEISQLTDDPLHIDMEPTYLPNGDIVFCSDRGEFGSQCSGNYFQNKRIVNRYRMSADGSNVRAISNNKDFDRYNHVLDNGQLIFTRWEYQERHLYYVHNVWVSRPDGSMADAIYKEHINSNAPMALRDTRQVYGTDKLISIGCGHHEWEQGAVTLIDPRVGTNDPDGMTLITPYISKREGGIGKGKIPEGGGVPDNGGLYQQPYALSENSFLVSYAYNYPRAYSHGFHFGLYYIDIFGNKELIHRDPVYSVWYPVALKERAMPPIIPDSPGNVEYAETYVTNVYQGMEDVQPGEIKYIRIGHHTEWPAAQIDDQPHNYNHYHYTPSGSWSRTLGMSTWSPARVIGTVPVEEDGSAYFKVPANVPVYFQALDENMLEVRRMRSFITFGNGETRGCTGCHESRDEAPMGLTYLPKALKRSPSHPEPPAWGDTTLPDYEAHIHQIFENNCAGCHGAENPAAGLEFSSRRIDGYYQAYRTLFGLKAEEPTPVHELKAWEITFGDHHNVVVDKEALVKMERNEYPGQLVTISNKFSDASVTKVREFGSGNSKLIDVLMSDKHKKHVRLNDNDWQDLVTWIDLNAPYWGSFIDKEPVRHGGKPKRVTVKIGEPFVEQVK